MEQLQALISLCEGRTVYIQTHNFPDPDAIGSAYGLQQLLAQFGVSSRICYEGSIDKLSTTKMLELLHIRLYSYDELRSTLTDDDYIICVDSQKNNGNITDFVGQEVACIDHHPTYQEAEYRYSDVRIVGACATLIAEYYQRLGKTPSREAATAMLYGIRMDTLQFSRGVTAQDIDAFSYLFPLADQSVLDNLERNNMEFSDLQAYGAAIENIRLYDYVGFSRIPFACPDAMIAILSDFILSLVEVEVAVIYCERADGLKLSVRSERPEVHAGRMTNVAMAGLGSGGGHAAMAGGLIPRANLPLLGNYPDDYLRDIFLDAMKKTMQNY